MCKLVESTGRMRRGNVWKGMSFLYFFFLECWFATGGNCGRQWPQLLVSAVENLAAGGSTSSPYNVRDCSLHFIPNCLILGDQVHHRATATSRVPLCALLLR